MPLRIRFVRNRTRAVVIAAFFGAMAATPAFAADPTGDWQVEGGFANIRVAECGGAMWGAVAWEKTPGGRDKNNSDSAKRSRPTLGMATLLDMKKKPAADEWEGQVYDAQTTGSLFKASIKPKTSDQLEVKGCFLLFCDGQTWARVAPPIPSSPLNGQARGAAKGASSPSIASPAAPKPAAPKTVGAAAKAGAPGQTADIGDICLLPEISNAIANRGR